MIILPLDRSAFYTESVVLEQVSYDFTFQYNTQEATWYLDLGLSGNSPVIQGLKITTNSNILELHAYLAGIPPGRLFALDLERGIGRIDRTGFSNTGRYALVYLTEEESGVVQ